MVHIPGCAIAAGEDHEVDAQPQHVSGGVAGVLGRGLTRVDGANHLGLKPTRFGRVLPHLAGVGDDLKPVDALDPFQRLDRPVLRFGCRPQLQGLFLNLRPIAAFEPDPPAKPRQGIDN